MINKLRSTENRKNIVYINFEDDRLYPLELGDLDDLIEGYYELYPDKRKERLHLFLDEIHIVKGWEIFVRRIYDSLNIQIYITGSSSKLTGSGIATSLRGRTITYEIFPLSFSEYLDFRNIKVKSHSSQSRSFIKNACYDFCLYGGFVELVEEAPAMKRKILAEYLDLIIYRDIMERHGIQKNALLRHLIKYCFYNLSTSLSITKLYHELKSQGHRLGKDTLFDYFSHLEEAFAVFSVPVLRHSLREEHRNPRKIYAVDTGFRNLFETAHEPDYGKLLENTVFLDLRRRTREVKYYKGKQEVDFFAIIDGTEYIVNACWNLDRPDTRSREVSGLLEAMEALGLYESFLITHDHEESIHYGKKTIHITPLWKWLLRNKI